MRWPRPAQNAGLNGLDDAWRCWRPTAWRRSSNWTPRDAPFRSSCSIPPAFAKNKTHYSHAMRAYKRLNARALKMLPVGGYLLTCSCSYHVHRADFREAPDAGRRRSAAGRADRPRRGRGERPSRAGQRAGDGVPQGLPAGGGRDSSDRGQAPSLPLLLAPPGRGSRFQIKDAAPHHNR